MAAHAKDHLIVRTSWLYGAGRANFVDTIRARAAEGGLLKVVDDQFGSPTWAGDLAEALERILSTDARGLLHFANRGACSRYELAGAILEIAGTRGARLAPITTTEAGRIAVRPAYSALDSALYTRLTGITPRPWREALGDYLREGGPEERA